MRLVNCPIKKMHFEGAPEQFGLDTEDFDEGFIES